MSDGFLESLLRDVMIIEMSRDSSGMINPFAAAGMAYGLGGDLSGSDLARLGTLIGIKGGFDGIGGNLLSTTKNTIRYTVPVEELLNSKSYQAYSVDLIGLDKERREATKTLWDMYLVKHPDYHEDVMMMYDDANKITHGIGPLPAIILVASFVYYKYWHIDTPKWFACRHEIKNLCQDKSVVWDVVFQIQDACDNDSFGAMVFADQYSYENYLRSEAASRAAYEERQQREQESINAADSAQRTTAKREHVYLYKTGDKITLHDEGKRYDGRLQFGRIVKIKMFGRGESKVNDSAVLVIRLIDKRVVFGLVGACN